MFKRIYTLLLCLFLIFNSFCFSVFADSQSNVPDGYSPCGLNDQVDAFKSYCQSRNLIVEGSGLDVVTAFTTNAYQGAVTKVGLDINELQNEIYKRTKDNLGAKWFFTSTGISAYNRIFAELLQNNDLEVGDSASEADNTVYSGKYFDGSLVWITNENLANYTVLINSSNIIANGSNYGFTTEQVKSLVDNGNNNLSFNINGSDYSLPISKNNDNSNNGRWIGYWFRPSSASGGGKNTACYCVNNYNNLVGYPCIWYSTANNKYCIGSVTYNSSKYNGSAVNSSYNGQAYRVIQDTTNFSNATVYYTTNNSVINNNNYEGDTYITNEGDVVTDNPESSPGGQDPGWDVGGGQGSYNDGQGNNYTINFPDFELPDLNIDWSIQGLGNKFPFSIPFDIASLISVLNAQPEAPRFQGTVNFGFTTWDYDINLEEFDTVAQVCRIAELLLLVFGLILITRSIIKG